MRNGDERVGERARSLQRTDRTLPISVVIPAYNRASVIGDALMSVAAQSHGPAEVIVIDDGSTDATAEVARQHGAKVLRLGENRGVSHARNSGIALSAQPWIAMLDSDDEWLPHHLATLWTLSEGHRLVFTSMLGTGGPSPRVQGPARESVITSPADLLQPMSALAPSCCLVRRKEVLAVGGFDEAMTHAEDLDLWIRIVERSSARGTTVVTVRYRAGSDQAVNDHGAITDAHELLVARYESRSWWRPDLAHELDALDTWDDLRRRVRERDLWGAARAAALLSRPRLTAGLIRRLRVRAEFRRRSRPYQTTLAPERHSSVGSPGSNAKSLDGDWTVDIGEPSLRERVGSRLRKARELSLLVPSRRRAAYVGWLGHGNVGDEAVLEAYRVAYPELVVRAVPADGSFLRRVAPLLGRRQLTTAMIGGGTLIGTAYIRLALEQLLDRCPSLPLIMLGTGVEDPAWDADYASEVGSELRRWKPLLDRCVAGAAVRGPRSAEILADLGIESEVVGDPALLLGEALLRPEPTEIPTVVMNVGVARHIFGARPDDVLRSFADAATIAIERGRSVRVVPVWPRDIEYSAALVARVGQGCVLVPEAIEIGALLRELAAADAIVGMKLHSVVLAAAVGTPGVMVAYHPKCLDFHASVGRLDSTIRTDQLEDGSLSELTDRLLSEHAHEASALVERVRALRESLRAHARASAWHLAQS